MNKSQKMKTATRRVRGCNIKENMKKIIAWPRRACESIWNWLKSIDIVGMINLTLLAVIIVLFFSLVSDVVCCNKKSSAPIRENNNVVMTNSEKPVESRKVVQRKFETTLPIRANKKTNIKPKIQTVKVAKPRVVRELSLPVRELPKQKLYGDVIIDVLPSSPILSNGVKIDGNLFIQNMRKYTIPCGAQINGHLFIRNVTRVNFCGSFTVNGNIYVNRQSSFGPLPQDARIRGQIIL